MNWNRGTRLAAAAVGAVVGVAAAVIVAQVLEIEDPSFLVVVGLLVGLLTGLWLSRN